MIPCESVRSDFFLHYSIRNCWGLELLHAENKVVTAYLLADASRSNLPGEGFLVKPSGTICSHLAAVDSPIVGEKKS